MRKLIGSVGTVPLLVLAMAVFAAPASAAADHDTAHYYDAAIDGHLSDANASLDAPNGLNSRPRG